MRAISGSETADTSWSPTSRKARAGFATSTPCSGSPNTSTAPTTSRKLVELGVLSAEESQRFERAQNFLWTVRCHLHYLAGRAEERLTFDLQTEIGRHMGYTDHAGSRGVERFMKHYFLIAKDVGDLTRIFCAILEADQKRKRRLSWMRWGSNRRSLAGFVIDGERLAMPSEDFFKKDPVALLRLFHVAQEHDLDIHPRALRAASQSLRLINSQLREDPEANRLFLEILTSRKDPETALRRMNEAGVFGRFIPDFGRVVAQMQYDMYHVYTVDEHTLFAIGILHKIASGALKEELPLATQMIETIVSRRALYLAVLLHDIAKGRGGDHSVIGEQIALKLGPRLGLSAEETETVAWLVRWHLLMSNTAFKRDIGDPQTIARLCRAGAVAGAPEAAAGSDRGGYPRRRPQGVERMEGGAAARTLSSGDRGHFRRARRRGAGFPGRGCASRGARAAAGFQRRGVRHVREPRLPVLLAVLRSRTPCPACPPDA